MRAIFLVLLVVNVAFFSHQAFFYKDDAVVQPNGDGQDGRETANNLQLLSELSEQNALAKKADAKVVENRHSDAPTGVTGGELCLMLGPYEQLLQAEYAVERLTALGASAHIAPVEIQEGESFWVYLRPEMSEKEAVRRLYELQKKSDKIIV